MCSWPRPIEPPRRRRVDDFNHHRANVDANTVTLDVGDNRCIRNVEAMILVCCDWCSLFWNFNVLIRHGSQILTVD